MNKLVAHIFVIKPTFFFKIVHKQRIVAIPACGANCAILQLAHIRKNSFFGNWLSSKTTAILFVAAGYGG